MEHDQKKTGCNSLLLEYIENNKTDSFTQTCNCPIANYNVTNRPSPRIRSDMRGNRPLCVVILCRSLWSNSLVLLCNTLGVNPADHDKLTDSRLTCRLTARPIANWCQMMAGRSCVFDIPIACSPLESRQVFRYKRERFKQSLFPS